MGDWQGKSSNFLLLLSLVWLPSICAGRNEDVSSEPCFYLSRLVAGRNCGVDGKIDILVLWAFMLSSAWLL